MQIINQILDSQIIESSFSWLDKHGIKVAFIILVAWFLYHLVNFISDHFVKKIVRRSRSNHLSETDAVKRQKTLTGLFSTLLRIIIIATAAMMVSKQFFPHINYTPIFASAGIIGVALGFGAQSLVKDFITGVFIISENQYRVGDVVDIEGAAGTVEHVGIRSTVIRDVEGNVHYLPNGTIAHVINKTMGFSKVNFTIAVKPDTDVDLLTDVINKTGLALSEDKKWKDKITEPPRFINISGFTRLGMDIIVNGTTTPSDQWAVSGEMRRRLLTEFKKHKIELASPPSALAASKKK